MRLLPDDAALFFKLMPALQTFANRHLKIIKALDRVEQYQEISNEQRVKLRNALYKKPALIDQFVQENSLDLSPNELAIVQGWKNFVAGDFFIDRVLKKHAIFIANNKVYGVLALIEPLEIVLSGMPFPAYVKTVLLPFKGKIIYDGLLEGYNVFFGSGISGSMSNTYRAAKQQGKIIESLDPGWQPTEPKISIRKDWGPLLDEVMQKASKFRASANDPAILGPAFSLVRASLEFAKIAIEKHEDINALEKALRKTERALRKAEDVMYFSEYEF
jgi:hypothetical protein